jgi:hypothetical protein
MRVNFKKAHEITRKLLKEQVANYKATFALVCRAMGKGEIEMKLNFLRKVTEQENVTTLKQIAEREEEETANILISDFESIFSSLKKEEENLKKDIEKYSSKKEELQKIYKKNEEYLEYFINKNKKFCFRLNTWENFKETPFTEEFIEEKIINGDEITSQEWEELEKIENFI